MKKSKIILFCLAILFVADYSQAKNYVSFDGLYTNVIYSINDYLWRDRNKYSFEDIQKECESQPENPDVWYIAGYYWRYKAHNREKSAECFKKSMELAPNVLKSTFSYAKTACYRQNPEELFNILTNSFHYINESYYTVAWSGCLDYFNKSETNYLDKLYVFIQNKKNVIPDGDYALFMISMKLGKYDVFLACAERLMKKTENRIIKHNTKNFVEFIGMDINNNPELMAKRNRILNKSQSPYQQAMQKIKDAQNKHDNPELFALTSNAFELAANQSRRIDALHELVFYCPNSQKEKIKRFLEIIAEEKVTSFSRISKMAWYFKKIGATNDLYVYLISAIKQMPKNKSRDAVQILHMIYDISGSGKINKNDEKVLKLMTEHFKANYDVINKIADVYQKYKCYDEELQYRNMSLKLTNNKDYLSKTNAKIAELKIKSGQQIDDEKFVAENIKKAKNNFAVAKAISTFYLSKGKTNSALEILMKCANNTDFPNESKDAVIAVLNTEWGCLEEKMLDSIFELFKNNYDDLKTLSNKMMYHLVNAGLVDKSFDFFIFTAKHNRYVCDIEQMLTEKRVNAIIDRVITEKITGDTFLRMFIHMLNNMKYKAAAYRLSNYYINLPNKNPHKYYIAIEMLEYAFRIGDTNLCYEIVDKIDGFVKQKIIMRNLSDNLCYYMLKLNLTNKYDLWVDFKLDMPDEKNQEKNLYDFIKWYMRAGKTNKLKTFLANNCSTNLPTGDLFDLLNAFKYLNDTNQYKLYVETIGARLVNYNMVRMYGVNYLDKLNYLSGFSGKSCDEEIDEFVQKWFYNDRVNIDTKFSLLYRAKSNKIEYINYLAKKKSELSDRRLMDIARLYINYGVTNKGIEFYYCVLNSPKSDDNNKINAILNLASIYFENKNYQAANNVLDKIAKRKNELSNRRLMNIARLYISYGVTNKGTEFYSCVLDSPKSDDNNKINTILSLARIYIENKEYQSAANVLNKTFQFNLDEKNYKFFSNLGSLYSRAFMYGKAVDCYIEAINRAERISNVERAVIRIFDVWHSDSEIEYAKLAEINFTNKNECMNYTAKALFLLLDNNSIEAEKYIYKAEEKLKTNKEKYALWNAWNNVARVNGNDNAQLLANKKMFQYNKNQNYRYNRIYDINRLLRKTTNYTELISFNSDILNVVTNERRRNEIILNICDAYLRLGDTNAAWKSVLQSNDAETIKRLAYRINKSNEMLLEFEKRIEDSNGRNFTIMAITLSQYNLNNKKAAEKLASLLDKKLPEINVRDYVDLSMIYLNCGYRNKAKKLLEKYVDNLDTKNQETGRKMIDKYLDSEWRHSLHSRGYIPNSENLQRLWGRR